MFVLIAYLLTSPTNAYTDVSIRARGLHLHQFVYASSEGSGHFGTCAGSLILCGTTVGSKITCAGPLLLHVLNRDLENTRVVPTVLILA